ncbi:MAG: hypothetical protein EOM67_01525 [Spirochaetia bacterium]|nr:hypothetical protein [Spirochaetia bacterium]
MEDDEEPIEETIYQEEPEEESFMEEEDDGSIETFYDIEEEEAREGEIQQQKSQPDPKQEGKSKEQIMEETPDPGFVKTTIASLRQYNTAGSVGRYTWDKTADFFTGKKMDIPGRINKEIEEGVLAKEDAGAFVNCQTERDFRRVRREILDKRKLEKAGFWQGLIPTLIAGASDPLYYIPMTGALKAASVSKAVLGSTLMAGTSAGLRYATQETMTPLDIAYETIGAGVLTGALGGASKLVQSVDFNGWTKAIGKALQRGSDENIEIKGGEAFVDKVSEVGKKTAEKATGFAKETIFNSPYLKGIKNEDESMSDLVTSLLRGNSVITKETRAGQTQILSGESIVSYKLNDWIGVKEKYGDHFSKFVQTDFAKQSGTDPDYFNLSVTRYLRDTVVRVEDGKISTIYRGSSDVIPEVKAAGDELAEFWRKLLDDAKKYKVFEAEPPPRDLIVRYDEEGKISTIYKDELEKEQAVTLRKILEKQRRIEKTGDIETKKLESIRSQKIRDAKKHIDSLLKKSKSAEDKLADLIAGDGTTSDITKFWTKQREINAADDKLIKFFKKQEEVKASRDDITKFFKKQEDYTKTLRKTLRKILEKQRRIEKTEKLKDKKLESIRSKKIRDVKKNIESLQKSVKTTEDKLTELIAEQETTKFWAEPQELKIDTDDPINIWKRLQKDVENPKEYTVAERKFAENIRKLTSKDTKEEGILTENSVLTKKEYEMPIEDFMRRAKEGNLSDSNVTSIGHFTRDYDIEAIYKNEDQFRDMIKRSILKNNPTYEPNKVNLLTEETISHIKRLDKEARKPFKGKVAGTFTNSRTVAITDELLEDFLVNNPLQVGDSMVRKLSAATELNRVAIEKGYGDWGDLLEKYSAGRIEKKANLNLVGEASENYDKLTKDNVQLLSDIGEILTGNYGSWDNPKLARVAQSIKIFNAMTQLGMVVLSSIADISGLVAKHGLKDTVGGIIDSFKKAGIAKQQGFERFVNANDAALMSSKLFDDTYKGKSAPFEKMGKTFFKMSFLPAWDNHWKKIAATLHYGDILDSCLGAGTKESELFLRQNRITKAMKEKISKSYELFGYEEGGNRFLPLDKIVDEDVKRALFSALHTAANETIITPGAGDIPRVLRKNWGSLLFQYKSFAFAYINNIITPMFMQKESRKHTAAYISTALALGGLSTYLKGLATGRETDIEKKDFWVNTVKNAGFFGFLFDTGDSIVSFASDPERAFSRLSPLFDFFARTTRAGVAAVTAPFKKGEMSNEDRHAIKRCIPFNNLFYYNRAIEEMITSDKTKRRRKRRNK